MKKTLFILFAGLISTFCYSQQNSLPDKTIFDSITDNSNPSKGKVTLHQDERLKDLVYKKKATNSKNKPSTTIAGFRVQVFSSNERTAKTTAYKVEEKVLSKFPNYAVYVSYTSPFWKVRIGDCKTTEEAQILRAEVSKAFPEFQQETYVVKDQVFIFE
jgi:hypothetical protein